MKLTIKMFFDVRPGKMLKIFEKIIVIPEHLSAIKGSGLAMSVRCPGSCPEHYVNC